jgi:hypothetical protein
MKRYRTPSFNKSFSARTTGRATRSIKRTCNPYYGKKGSGWINDPERAAYNHLYNKTTQSVHDHSSFDGGLDFASNCFSFIGGILIFFTTLLQFALTLFMLAFHIGVLVVLIKIFLFFVSIF